MTLTRSLARLASAVVVASLLVLLGAPAPAAADITYIYDALGRLRAVVNPASNEAAIYSYDAVGNLLSISRQSAAVVSIIDFQPTKGPVGTTVHIYGTGFSATASQNTVTFNGTTATIISATETEIVATVPGGATTGPIAVTTPAGSATTVDVFTVGSSAPTISSFTPTIGAAGTSVTISGANFEPVATNDRVVFNTDVRLGAVTSASPTTIAVTVPAVGSGRITVSTPGGQVTSAADLFVPPAPYTAADVAVTARFTLGQPVPSVSIGTAGKIGLLVFDGAANQRVSLGFAGVTFSGVVLTLLDPQGVAIASTSVGTSGGDLDVLLPRTGSYTLMVDPTGSSTGSLTVYAFGPVTTPLTIDGPDVTVTLQPGQDARLPFTGAANQRVSLGVGAITGLGVTCCGNPLAVSIVKPDGTTLASTNLLSAGGDLDVLLPVAGVYTAVLDATLPQSGSATVTLTSPVTTGLTIDGPDVPVSLRPGQDAWLPFTGAANQRVSLGVGAISGLGVTCCGNPLAVSIVKPDGTTLASVNLYNLGGDLDVVLPVDGTYTAVVDVTLPIAGTLTATLTSPVTTAMTVGGPSLPVSLRPGQDLRSPFTGSAGQSVHLAVTGISGFGVTCCGNPLAVSIVKADGTTLASMSVFSGGNTIDAVLPVAGTYTVVIDVPLPVAGSLTATLTSP
jgi:IPT/TIG domain/RHS Repeat